ncbi:MAG: phage gp6-like head-tail connector protein [Hyphomicrobiales bacterium]|nr:MAG: phage gp6-like head-tail connector protein [Hyphomicrobiales bacterium]
MVRVITPPAPLVGLELARGHLRVDDDTSDVLIEAYIAAASAHIDGPGGWLGRAIGIQTLEVRSDRFGSDLFPLAYPPLIDVVSVSYDDGDGVAQTLDPDTYFIDPAGVLLAYGASWPNARLHRGSVRIRYRAGYVTDPTASVLEAAVPPAITAAVLLMVGDMFSRRETTVDGSVGTVPMSTTVEALLGPYRVWSL